MKNDWSECSIGDALTLQRGFDITKKEQVSGRVPVVSSSGIKSFHSHSKAKAPGVVLGRKGTLGTVFFLSEDFWPHDTTLWVNDFKGNNEQFVYYFFKSISNILQNLDVGTSNPALNRNHVHPIKMWLPSLSEQKRIADTLGSLDDKIELNRQMNSTLEGIAQALFQSWFVDFDPVIDNAIAAGNPIPEAFAARAETRSKALAHGTANRDVAKQFPATFQFTDEMGWIPEGWVLKTLGDAVSLLDSKRIPLSKNERSIMNGPFPYYGASGIVDYINDHIFEGDHLLISEDGICIHHILLLFQVIDINPYITGAVQPKLNQANLKQIPFLFASRYVLDKFAELTEDLYQKIYSNEDELITLTGLRDTLLPKLISGEIRIPEAEKLTEEALA